MKKLPSFLKISSQPSVAGKTACTGNFSPYQPLLGLWLIDMALTGNWIEEPPSESLQTTFCDSDFLRVFYPTDITIFEYAIPLWQ